MSSKKGLEVLFSCPNIQCHRWATTTIIKQLAFAIEVAAAIPASPRHSDGGDSVPVRQEGSVDAMGSVTTVVTYGQDPIRSRSAIADALREMQRLDGMLSNYKPKNEWNEINQLAARQPNKETDKHNEKQEACTEYSRKSEGTFDISV